MKWSSDRLFDKEENKSYKEAKEARKQAMQSSDLRSRDLVEQELALIEDDYSTLNASAKKKVGLSDADPKETREKQFAADMVK